MTSFMFEMNEDETVFTFDKELDIVCSTCVNHYDSCIC